MFFALKLQIKTAALIIVTENLLFGRSLQYQSKVFCHARVKRERGKNILMRLNCLIYIIYIVYIAIPYVITGNNLIRGYAVSEKVFHICK